MSRRGAMLLSAGCIGVAVGVVGLCRPPLAPSEEALLDYFRNARLFHFRTGQAEGRVRRVWPEGQKYVNAVLAADAELQKALHPLHELDAVDSLWPQEDPRWQDKAAVAERLSALVEQVEGGRSERRILLEKLGEAVAQSPLDLAFPTPEAPSAFVAQVWDALSLFGTPLREGEAIVALEESGAAHLRLVGTVQECAEPFDPEQLGLKFTDETCQRSVEAQYETLQRHLRERREAFVRHAEEQLLAIAPRLKKINKHVEKREYAYLTRRRAYLRDELEAIPKALDVLSEAVGEELKKLHSALREAEPDKKDKLQAPIVFQQCRLQELRSETREWKARVQVIFEKVKAVEAGEVTARP